MRINNPKSIVGYQRSSNADALAYNLATVGQVKAAVSKLETTILNLLEGDGLKKGISQGHGYAWLNGEGKVDVSLIPALAITNTQTVEQSVLKSAASIPTTLQPPSDGWASEFDRLLNIWLKDQVDNAGRSYQVGDIIIVLPEDNTTGATDPVYAGSYILTEVPGYNNQPAYFAFAKLAYADGNIVTINGKAPTNSAGHVTLFLSDILKEKYYVDYAAATNGTAQAEADAETLSRSVYRLVTLDEGNNGYRFAFIDNSNVGQGAVIPYTKLKEFTDEQESVSGRFDAVNRAIADLTDKHNQEIAALELKHDNEIAALTLKHDTEHEALSGEMIEKTGYISGVVGNKNDIANRELSATIFAQTKKLRIDVDDNYNAYTNTKQLTNDMLQLIHTNVSNLHTGLEKRAVRLYMQPFVWRKAEAVKTEFDSTNPQYMYQVSASDVLGVLTWTHEHIPVNTDTGTVAQGASNASSEERILAVYDENNNLVNVDMIVTKNNVTGLSDTKIIVETEYIGEDESHNYLNTLEGKEWTLLIAKTISGIDFNDPLVDLTIS